MNVKTRWRYIYVGYVPIGPMFEILTCWICMYVAYICVWWGLGAKSFNTHQEKNLNVGTNHIYIYICHRFNINARMIIMYLHY